MTCSTFSAGSGRREEGGAHAGVLASLDEHAELVAHERAQRDAVRAHELVLPRAVLRVARVGARVREQQRLRMASLTADGKGERERARTCMSFESACPTSTLSFMSAATCACTSANGLASPRQRVHRPRAAAKPTRAVGHVRGTNAGVLGAIVDDALARAHKFVEEDRAVEVHERDACERTLRAARSHTHHLAVERDVPPCPVDSSVRTPWAGRGERTDWAWSAEGAARPAIMARRPASDSPLRAAGSSTVASIVASAASSVLVGSEAPRTNDGGAEASVFRRLLGSLACSSSGFRFLLFTGSVYVRLSAVMVDSEWASYAPF